MLWPSLARVDVRCGPHVWVAKGVVETEVIAGLEVIFRFGEALSGQGRAGEGAEPEGTLFVGVGGDVMMVSGDAGGTTRPPDRPPQWATPSCTPTSSSRRRRIAPVAPQITCSRQR